MKRTKMWALIPHGQRTPEMNNGGMALFKKKSQAQIEHAEWDNKLVPVYVTIERVNKTKKVK